MLHKRIVEFLAGLFMLAGIIAVLILAFQVSGIGFFSTRNSIKIIAAFDNVGDLQVKAPVTIAGVKVGEVGGISLDQKTFKAKVVLFIDKKQTTIPVDTSAQILTSSLIGAKYIALIPGSKSVYFKNGDLVSVTSSAIIFENFISQCFHQRKNKD